MSENQARIIHSCAAAATTFANFAYRVQMTIAQGDEGCLIFRVNLTSAKYYGFCIGSDGRYAFIAADQNDNVTTKLRGGFSSTIHTGLNQANTVTVIAQGSEFDMYINGQYVLTVNDHAYSQGSIAVGVSDDTNPTDVAFSNAQVWKLP